MNALIWPQQLIFHKNHALRQKKLPSGKLSHLVTSWRECNTNFSNLVIKVDQNHNEKYFDKFSPLHCFAQLFACSTTNVYKIQNRCVVAKFAHLLSKIRSSTVKLVKNNNINYVFPAETLGWKCWKVKRINSMKIETWCFSMRSSFFCRYLSHFGMIWIHFCYFHFTQFMQLLKMSIILQFCLRYCKEIDKKSKFKLTKKYHRLQSLKTDDYQSIVEIYWKKAHLC